MISPKRPAAEPDGTDGTTGPVDDSLVEERRRLLLDELVREGRVVAATAARRFGVSEDSIRRDLRHFDRLGLAQRVRGGAVPRATTATAAERLAAPSGAQLACARAVAERLQVRGGVVVLDNGSTSVRIAEHLAPRDGLTVVTGNPAAAAAAWAAGVAVVLLGGVVDPGIGGALDATAVDALRGVRCDVAVLGVCAVAAGDGVVTDLAAEVGFKRALVAAAAEVWVVATTEKVGGRGAFVVAPPDAVDLLVTDAPAAQLAELSLTDRTEVVHVEH